MKHSILEIDDLDSRREVIRLLNHLTVMQRLLFLSWACLECHKDDPKCTVMPNIPSMRPKVKEAVTDLRASMAITNEILLDLCMLSCDWKLNLVKCVARLEAIVRKPEIIERDWDSLALLQRASKIGTASPPTAS